MMKSVLQSSITRGLDQLWSVSELIKAGGWGGSHSLNELVNN